MNSDEIVSRDHEGPVTGPGSSASDPPYENQGTFMEAGGDPARAVGDDRRSLQEMHGSVAVPPAKAGFWQQWRAFAGPAILISVGYMDPGNWGTDLAGGAQFKYRLLSVVALASLMAVFLQVIAARLGVVTGIDLAQCCRDYFPRWTRWPNWISMEIAIAATDLAESLGSAVALNLLFHIPMTWAIIMTTMTIVNNFNVSMFQSFRM